MVKNEPLTPKELKGVFPALVTIMDYSGKVDLERQEMLIEDLISAGIDGIVVMGTTGQAATFDYDEHISQVVKTFYIVNKRVPIIVGAGSNDTNKAIELAQKIEREIGPTTFLMATGYYLKPPLEAAISHYLKIANSIEGNIVLYNVPGRTVLNLEDEPVIYLANIRPDKFIGMKQADPSGDEFTKRIIDNIDTEKFAVVSGEDNKVYEIMKIGGTGVISATANVCPKLFKKITDAMDVQKYEEARKYQEEVMPFVEYAFSKPGNNPINIAYLFWSGVRGCNDCLENMLITARAISMTLKSEKFKERANKIKNLMERGDKLVSEYLPEYIGIDLNKYRERAKRPREFNQILYF